ncbi:MAG: CerR family C-terminal domain-containing protein [Desulfobacterales bacterium]|jgi:TetR/AcrR family transcriptional regulator, regulator of cefoperazone and chloramphenicol sensitivity
MSVDKTTAVPKITYNLDARARLLEAGVDIFGKHGFDAATTRMIAKKAGVNIAAITYYFNGKEGLYHTVVSHITGKLESQVESTLIEIEKWVAEGRLNREEALVLLEKLLEKMINFMVGSPEAPGFARIVLREQLYPSSAYDIIFNRIMAPMINAVAKMVAKATGETVSRVTSLRALTLIGQIIVFRVARETIVRALDLEGYSSEETAEIRGVILEQTRAAIEELYRLKKDKKKVEY